MNETIRTSQIRLEVNRLQDLLKKNTHWLRPSHPKKKKSLDDVDLAAGNSYIYLETGSVITCYFRAWAWRGCDPFKREPVTLEVNCPPTVGEWWRINK